jgi:hypothetical protein
MPNDENAFQQDRSQQRPGVLAIRNDRGRADKPVQRRKSEQQDHQRQLDREKDAVLGFDQRAQAAELDDRKRQSAQHEEPHQRHRDRRKLRARAAGGRADAPWPPAVPARPDQ